MIPKYEGKTSVPMTRGDLAEIRAEMKRQEFVQVRKSGGGAKEIARRAKQMAKQRKDESKSCKCPDCGSHNLGCYNSECQLMVCNDCGRIIETELGKLRRIGGCPNGD